MNFRNHWIAIFNNIFITYVTYVTYQTNYQNYFLPHFDIFNHPRKNIKLHESPQLELSNRL